MIIVRTVLATVGSMCAIALIAASVWLFWACADGPIMDSAFQGDGLATFRILTDLKHMWLNPVLVTIVVMAFCVLFLFITFAVSGKGPILFSVDSRQTLEGG